MNFAEHLRGLEQSLLTAEVRHDAHRVGNLLTEDFVEIGSSGRTYDRAAIVALLQSEQTSRAEMQDFAAREMATGVMLVTYRTVHSRAGTHSALRSSVWVLREGRWQMTFHQGTPAA